MGMEVRRLTRDPSPPRCRRPVGREEEVRVTGVRQTISVDELVTRATLDHEGLGTLDSPLVVVDLASAPEVPVASVAALRSLPCVLVGVGEEATPGSVGTSLDVVASDPAVVDAIEQMVASKPRAAVALVLLLRGRDGRSLDGRAGGGVDDVFHAAGRA